MTPRRIRERLVAARFRPVARIGRCRLRLRAMDRAPYPAHETKAVAADAFERGLMAVGRANEGTRLRDDAGAVGHVGLRDFDCEEGCADRATLPAVTQAGTGSAPRCARP